MKYAENRSDTAAVRVSTRMYRHLLVAYPPRYRREYGPAMAQLFRDQCRDAWRGGHAWGLIGLWFRVLPDLVKTSLQQQFSMFKGGKNMMQKVGVLLRPQLEPRRLFVAIFAAVFVLVAGTTTLVTLLLPESYSSTALIKLEQNTSGSNREAEQPLTGHYDPYFIQAQFEIIQSERVLSKVISDLQLNRQWGKKYGGGKPLRSEESLAILNARLDLRPVRNTSLVEIRIFSDEPSEAAKLANAIARVYQENNAAGNQPTLVVAAAPGLKPVRPNKPLNITLGILCGALLALVAGAGVAGIAFLSRRKRGTS